MKKIIAKIKSYFIKNKEDPIIEIIYSKQYKLKEWSEVKYALKNDSGFDLRVILDIDKLVVYNGYPVLLNTGIKMKIPKGYEVVIRPRSGMSKNGLLAAFGTIDQDYRGEIKVVMYNMTAGPLFINNGDRIAQAVLQKKYHANIKTVNEFSDETVRSDSGFGSTGLN